MHLPGLKAESLFEKAKDLIHTQYIDPFGERLLGLWEALLLRHGCHALVLTSVTEMAQQAKAEKAPASDKVRAFVQFSRLVLNFSEPDAQAFFEEVIKLAQEIDREALDQIGVLDALTVGFAGWSKPDRTLAACQAFRFVTDVAIRLRHEEHFPWDEAVRCVVRLSPPAAFASISRWSDQAIQTHEHTLPVLISELDHLKLLMPSSAVALLALLRRTPNPLLRALAASTSRAPSETLFTPILELANDCLVNTAPLERLSDGKIILNAAEETRCPLNHPILKRLRDTISFLDQLELVQSGLEEPLPREANRLDVSTRRFVTKVAIEEAAHQARADSDRFHA